MASKTGNIRWLHSAQSVKVARAHANIIFAYVRPLRHEWTLLISAYCQRAWTKDFVGKFKDCGHKSLTRLLLLTS